MKNIGKSNLCTHALHSSGLLLCFLFGPAVFPCLYAGLMNSSIGQVEPNGDITVSNTTRQYPFIVIHLFFMCLLVSSSRYIWTTWATVPSKIGARGNINLVRNPTLQESIPFLIKNTHNITSSFDWTMTVYFMILSTTLTHKT